MTVLFVLHRCSTLQRVIKCMTTTTGSMHTAKHLNYISNTPKLMITQTAAANSKQQTANSSTILLHRIASIWHHSKFMVHDSMHISIVLFVIWHEDIQFYNSYAPSNDTQQATATLFIILLAAISVR